MKNNLPLISVVMPVFNNEKYVLSAVNSVISQGYDKYELIVVDDGSTDNTPYLLDELALQHDEIKVIHQENQWIYASFNNGVAAAKGEYVYILNSDDKLREGVMELLDEKIEQYHHPDIIWTQVICCKCDSEQRVIKEDIHNWSSLVQEEIYYSNQQEVRSAWPFFVKSKLAQNQANLYKRQLVVNHPFRNDVYGADTFFNIQIASDVRTAAVLDKPVYEYNIYGLDEMNASVGKYYDYEHSMFNEMFFEYQALFEKWCLKKEDYFDIIRKKRLVELSFEIRSLSSKYCLLTINEKLRTIFNEYVDDVILCCGSGDYREEMESRILSGTKTLLLSQTINETEEMYFVYELLDSLLRYEKDALDWERLENGVYHSLNPNNIGKSFYDKLKK